MTVPLPNQAPSATTKTADTAAARKRRRRAPAGGAADDCFTCSKRNVKCDRRRPYCSQCLEVGNECSGYKTQLTWGVGVASRGKLRGLSLPIAKSPPVSLIVGKKGSPTRTRAGSAHAAAAGQWSDQDEGNLRSRPACLDIPTLSEHDHAVSTPTTPYHATFDPCRLPRPEPTTAVSQGPPHWSHMPFSSSMPADGMRYSKFGHHSMGHGEHLGLSIDSMSEMEYHLSPMSHSFPRDEVPPFMHSPTIMYEGFTGHNSPVIPPSPLAAMVMEHRNAPTSCPSLVYAPSEHSSSLHSHPETFEAQLSSKLVLDCESIGTPDIDAYSTSGHSNGHYWGPSAADEDTASSQGAPELSSSLSAWPSAVESPVVHVSADLIAKMPFFLDYYENTMCPGMVFIDGPNNPFRDHILQLATGSRSLQHAICALAACNLRMKRKLSLGRHSSRDLAETRSAVAAAAAEQGGPGPEAPLDDQSLQEEYQHRNLAVHLLNEQLNDPAKSKHDSVLATILLLCHYRMAESGIARFHTQFAGVKKILAMRRASPFPPSRDSAWMEALFTYFDAISASINDREAQLNSSFFGASPDALLLPLGAENLVGCDRELFRIIVKLGRLNLLSQHRPVQNLGDSPRMARGIPSRSQSPLGSPLGHAYKPTHHQHQHLGVDVFGGPGGGNHRFDGNGFGTTLDDDDILSAAIPSSPAYDDHRSAFWREWKEARNALQTWSFDSQRLSASLPGPTPPTAAQIRDLCSLSEAFRYAALLYTERLASPQVPSSHSSFRNLVSQVVYYATSLEAGSSAEKFLLWPLFVAGSECVNELQQNIVRSKCRDIMARSGYMNNLAALDVLERLWAGDEVKEEQPASHGSGLYDHHQRLPGIAKHGPFNWAKCIGGPGIEVEWIMF